MKYRIIGADAAHAARRTLPKIGNLGGRLAEANRWGVGAQWEVHIVYQLKTPPHLDVDLDFDTFPRLHDLLPIGAHLCTYVPGTSARECLMAELAARFAARPGALLLMVRRWHFPLEHDWRTTAADVETALGFCLDTPGLVEKLMSADGVPLPAPFRLEYRSRQPRKRLAEDQLARFLDNFPEDRGRIMGAVRSEFGPFLHQADPQAAARFVSRQLGISVDPRLGELVTAGDVSYAAELAGADPAVCANLPSVNRVTSYGLSRAIHAAAYSEDVNRALSSIIRRGSPHQKQAPKTIERGSVTAGRYIH